MQMSAPRTTKLSFLRACAVVFNTGGMKKRKKEKNQNLNGPSNFNLRFGFISFQVFQLELILTSSTFKATPNAVRILLLAS